MSEGLLSRWARRKQAVRRQEREQAPPEAVAPNSLPETQTIGDAQVVQENLAADEGLAEAIARLPRLEDLTAETELAPFLRAGIPTALRKAALRRMWSVDPSIRDFVSEAREYAYDWNTPGGVPGLGPMLPTDDIKAMVERIMTGHAPRPAGGISREPSVHETSASEPSQKESPENVGDAQVVAPAAEAIEVNPQVVPVVDAETLHVDAAAHHPPENAVRPFQSPSVVTPLRRHGGAMPS